MRIDKELNVDELFQQNQFLQTMNKILMMFAEGATFDKIMNAIDEKRRALMETKRYGWMEMVEVLTELEAHANNRNEEKQQMKLLAYHDGLTGLYNRRGFKEKAVSLIKQHMNERLTLELMIIDIDHFKWVNDSLGHDAGDQLLLQAAERIVASVGNNTLLARLGGDEFIVIQSGIQQEGDIAEVAERIIDAFKQPMLLDDHEVRVTLSAGISTFPNDGTTLSMLMKKADKAMNQAKHQGRNHYLVFRPSFDQGDYKRLLLKSQFEQALADRQFYLEYQPRVDLESGGIIGLEALIRWKHPTEGIVAPGEFITLAEEIGFIIPLGEWVLREVCSQMKHWQEQGIPAVRTSINVSAKQFNQASFVDKVQDILNEIGIGPSLLEFEITESALMGHAKPIIDDLKVFKDMGIFLSIDDFGTGYSSLQYLKLFDVDALKIDRAFIKDLPRDKLLAKMIISLARKLRLQVIAEGVETSAQHAWLLNSGCHEAQGFLYSKALPASDIEYLLKA
ncbi:putative bifunctional diguanylate cyclase/phosphodiesterase [Paenibacillus sedimenti]|uniref:EAL domain-containing protein n=1 Tax=Paenibacillus sedimenti TaxID=2770274 RepID=A0A926QLP7_9BACL|nr:EAL domain-containing protein [Paenibacillus sedimenti]MBD0383860.1 EAL domain-containing protein [Paenibacillus sedimenti]